MIRETFERLATSGNRVGIVITLTFVIGLLTVLPAADEWNASQTRRAEAAKKLETTLATIGRLAELQDLAERKQSQLQQLRAQTTATDGLQAVREQFVALVRESGCQVRRVRSGAPAVRTWREGDQIAEQGAVAAGAETPYTLTTQPLAMSVAGPLPAVRALLGSLNDADKMMHIKTLAIGSVGQGSPGDAALDLEVLLYNLEKRDRAG